MNWNNRQAQGALVPEAQLEMQRTSLSPPSIPPIVGVNGADSRHYSANSSKDAQTVGSRQKKLSSAQIQPGATGVGDVMSQALIDAPEIMR